jgi:hypothetical protein
LQTYGLALQEARTVRGGDSERLWSRIHSMVEEEDVDRRKDHAVRYETATYTKRTVGGF